MRVGSFTLSAEEEMTIKEKLDTVFCLRCRRRSRIKVIAKCSVCGSYAVRLENGGFNDNKCPR